MPAGPPGLSLPEARPERRGRRVSGAGEGFPVGDAASPVLRPVPAPAPARPAAGMINAILVFNNHGKPRLVRFYQHLVRGRGRGCRWGGWRRVPEPGVGLGVPGGLSWRGECGARVAVQDRCGAEVPWPGPSGCPVAGSPPWQGHPVALPAVPGLVGSQAQSMARGCSGPWVAHPVGAVPGRRRRSSSRSSETLSTWC